jgi:hypothetical protein
MELQGLSRVATWSIAESIFSNTSVSTEKSSAYSLEYVAKDFARLTNVKSFSKGVLGKNLFSDMEYTGADSKDSDALIITIGSAVVVAGILGLLIYWAFRGRSGDSDDSAGDKKSGRQYLSLDGLMRARSRLRRDIAFEKGLKVYVEDELPVHASIRPSSNGSAHTYSFDSSGFSSNRDAVSLLYMWAQADLKRKYEKLMSDSKDGVGEEFLRNVSINFRRMTQLFDERAGYSEVEILEPQKNFYEFVRDVSNQLRYGPAVFNVEALTAHLGSYWAALNSGTATGKVSAWARDGVQNMWSALRDLAKGEHESLVHDEMLASHIKMMPYVNCSDQLLLVNAIHNLVVAELRYRSACCSVNGVKRERYLKSARGSVATVLGELKGYRASPKFERMTQPIIDYAKVMSQSIEEGISFSGISGPLKMIGVTVPNYGPVSATVISYKNGPHLVPLPPLRLSALS